MENNPENHPNPSLPPTSPAPSHAVMDVHASPVVPQSPQPNTHVPAVPPPEHVTAEHPKKDQPPATPPKNGAPKMVVILAVLVALSLTAMAVMVYLKNREQPKERHEPNSSEHTATPSATEKDVDDTTQTVDEAVNATDTAEELPEDDLSNQSLGL